MFGIKVSVNKRASSHGTDSFTARMSVASIKVGAGRPRAVTKDVTPPAELLYKRGLDSNRNGDYHQALRLFLAAHQLIHGEPRFLLSAANMQLKIGNVSAALDLYEYIGSYALSDKQADMVQEKLKEAVNMQQVRSCILQHTFRPKFCST